jgi:hypothetical protein
MQQECARVHRNRGAAENKSKARSGCFGGGVHSDSSDVRYARSTYTFKNLILVPRIFGGRKSHCPQAPNKEPSFFVCVCPDNGCSDCLADDHAYELVRRLCSTWSSSQRGQCERVFTHQRQLQRSSNSRSEARQEAGHPDLCHTSDLKHPCS